MTTSFKYYVIRTGSFLELRRARTRPKRYVSTLTIACREKQGYYDNYRQFKRTFRQVAYVGGKSIGVIHVKNLDNPIKNHTMKEITRAEKDVFLTIPRFKA